jgi:hypothetical protein
VGYFFIPTSYPTGLTKNFRSYYDILFLSSGVSGVSGVFFKIIYIEAKKN